MNFTNIIKIAVERNVDVDDSGNLDGFSFAAEQIIKDLDRLGYKIVTKTGKPVGSGLVSFRPKVRNKNGYVEGRKGS